MIPDYQALMLPMLKYLADGDEHSLRDMRTHLASACKLSESEKMELLPSGSDTTFNNRVRWARLYQEKAGLIETTKRGVYKITSRGLDVN